MLSQKDNLAAFIFSQICGFRYFSSSVIPNLPACLSADFSVHKLNQLGITFCAGKLEKRVRSAVPLFI